MDRLSGKIALVTGAARGIGAAITRRFHEEGARIIVNDLSLEAAQKAAAPLDGLGLAADVSDSAAVDAMFDCVRERFGRLDVLVNNAGIAGLEEDPEVAQRFVEIGQQQLAETLAGGEPQTHLDALETTSDEAWHRMIGVHLDGTFFCTRAAVRLLAESSAGCIVNMGSIMGTTGSAGVSGYCAAKAGILGLTRASARELASRRIRVNAIAPGWIATDMTAPLEAALPMLRAQTPLGRIGDVDDVAWAAVYLASDEARFVTGQVLSPNGGWTMNQ